MTNTEAENTKKRGRPAKAKTDHVEENDGEAPVKKGRGRPKDTGAGDASSAKPAAKELAAADGEKKSRGRPKTGSSKPAYVPTGKPRGRPKGSAKKHGRGRPKKADAQVSKKTSDSD